MEDVVKIRCPSCGGNIAIDRPYYEQIAGTVIECVHCSKRLTVPAAASPTPPPQGNPSDLKRTQKLQLVPVDSPKPEQPVDQDGNARFCPHCRAEVGPNDLVCVECEKQIAPPKEPANG